MELLPGNHFDKVMINIPIKIEGVSEVVYQTKYLTIEEAEELRKDIAFAIEEAKKHG